MSRAFQGRYAPEPQNTTTGLDAQIDQGVARFMQSAQLTGAAVPGSLPHQTLVTGFARVFYSPDSEDNYTISATTATEVDVANLAGTITCSGSPVRLDFRCRGVTASSTGSLSIGFTWDGDALESDGIFETNMTDDRGASAWTVVPSPTPGEHRFALAAHRVTADCTIYSGAGNSIELIATEV